MAASILDLSGARAHRLARALLAHQTEIDRAPASERAARELALDEDFDRALQAAESVRAPDALTRAIARACLARAVWRSAGDLGMDPDDPADAYTAALFELANTVHGETRRRRHARR